MVERYHVHVKGQGCGLNPVSRFVGIVICDLVGELEGASMGVVEWLNKSLDIRRCASRQVSIEGKLRVNRVVCRKGKRVRIFSVLVTIARQYYCCRVDSHLQVQVRQ